MYFDNFQCNQKGFALMYVLVGVLVLVALGGAYYFGKSQTSNSQSQDQIVSQSPKSTPAGFSADETANWKTYIITPDSSFGYAGYQIKLPVNWRQVEHSSNFPNKETFLNDQSPYFMFTVNVEANPKALSSRQAAEQIIDDIRNNKNAPWAKSQADKMLQTLKPYKNGVINGIKLQTFSEGYESGLGEVVYAIKDGIYIFNINDGNGEVGTTEEKMLDQILSTFKLLDQNQTEKTQTGNVQPEGADLKDIKYTLPENWEAEIREDALGNDGLSLAPKSGGGFFWIRVYDYPGTAGRREYYCQVSKVCIEGTTKFTGMNIGNISGYYATGIDNSGGGTEYFGAKGNKFYAISSFSPPPSSENEFDKNRKQVLDSLIF